MKNIQKLEIGAGVAASLAVSLCFFLFVVFIHNLEPAPSDSNPMMLILCLVWICSLMVAVGAYYNVVMRSNIALATLCIGGSVVIVVLGFWGFFIFIWGGLILGLLLYSPVILSVITIVLALNSRISKDIKTPIYESIKSLKDDPF